MYMYCMCTCICNVNVHVMHCSCCLYYAFMYMTLQLYNVMHVLPKTVCTVHKVTVYTLPVHVLCAISADLAGTHYRHLNQTTHVHTHTTHTHWVTWVCCCLGETLLLVRANSRRSVWELAGSNRIPCRDRYSQHERVHACAIFMPGRINQVH